MTLKFRYKVEPSGESNVKRPYVPLKIHGPKNNQDVLALLDSGADKTFIPKGLADFVGLDIRGKKHKANGVGGELSVVDSKVQLNIQQGHENYTLTLPCQIPLTEDKWSFMLVGREVFFDRFEIKFKQRDNKFELKRQISNL